MPAGLQTVIMSTVSEVNRFSRVVGKMLHGIGSRLRISSDLFCGNTFQRRSRTSRIRSQGSLPRRPAPFLLLPRLQRWLASSPRLRRLLITAGRQRYIEVRADQLRTVFAAEQMHQPPRVEAAFGEQARALILQLDAACRAVDHLAKAAEEVFTEHPDAAMLTSFPGVGTLAGARILAEIGDDRSRFTEARNLRAGPTSPTPSAPEVLGSGLRPAL
jgi:Transposase IS116/IS110/IS902 family